MAASGNGVKRACTCMYMYIASLSIDRIRGVWCETPSEDVIADIHWPLRQPSAGCTYQVFVRTALSRHRYGLHLADIGTDCAGPELVGTAPGSELLWTALD